MDDSTGMTMDATKTMANLTKTTSQSRPLVRETSRRS
jgi:hypothetical protein